MSLEEVRIVVHGGRRAEAHSAAYATIRALEAAGASVGLSSVLPLSDLSGDALRGARVVVGVQEGAVATAAPTLALAAPRRAGGGARPALAVIGAVVVLGLASVELRLRFGLGALLTVGLGGWAIWWTCFRRPG